MNAREHLNTVDSKRILFIGGWHLLSGLNHRTRHMARYLEQRFSDMDVVGFRKLYGGPPASLLQKLNMGVQNIVRNRIEINKNNNARQIVIRDVYAPPAIETPIKDLWRFINLCQIIDKPYDLAIFGHPGNAWTASLLRKTGRVKKLLYDDWDYHPGWETSSFQRRMSERREKLCVRASDMVFTVNGLLAELRKKQGAQHVEVVPNGLDFSLFSKARKKIPHPPTLIYMGTLSPLWNVELAVRALPILVKTIPDIRLLIAGYGPSESSLRELTTSLNLEDRVNFLGALDYQMLPSILEQADIGIITALPDSAFRKYATPLKIIEYMAAGLPVIASRLGHTEIIMQESKAGLLIDFSPEEFASAAETLFRDRSLYDQCSQLAHTYAEKFDWDHLFEKAYSLIVDLLED